MAPDATLHLCTSIWGLQTPGSTLAPQGIKGGPLRVITRPTRPVLPRSAGIGGRAAGAWDAPNRNRRPQASPGLRLRALGAPRAPHNAPCPCH